MGVLYRFLCFALLLSPGLAFAQGFRTLEPVAGATPGRVALVIGNADYAVDEADLQNPLNDAEDMAAVLHRLGFAVVTGTDLTFSAMDEAVRSFAMRARDAEVALIFFAGHGIELDGENYLVPVDAIVESPADLRRTGIPASWVLGRAREEASLAVLILDACRNNPFPRVHSRLRSLGQKGLGEMDAPRGTIVAFAAASGEAASDNDQGRNGLFTAALLAEIETPDMEFVAMLRRVRQRVYLDSQEKQFPTVRDMSIGSFVLNPSAPAPPPPIVSTEPEEQTGPSEPSEPPRLDPGPSSTALTQEDITRANADVERARALFADQAYADALPLLESAAELGHAEAQSALGWLLLFGEGVRPDTARAVDLLRAAAEHEHVAALTNLGYLHEHGIGVPLDLTEAASLYARAIRAGESAPDAHQAIALNNLGALVQYGRGVPQDSARAFQLIESATEWEVPAARANLGFLYEHGIGTARNEFYARQNYDLAGRRNVPWALYRLGQLYLRIHDVDAARIHLARAAELGHGEAERALRDLDDAPERSPGHD